MVIGVSTCWIGVGGSGKKVAKSAHRFPSMLIFMQLVMDKHERNPPASGGSSQLSAKLRSRGRETILSAVTDGPVNLRSKSTISRAGFDSRNPSSSLGVAV